MDMSFLVVDLTPKEVEALDYKILDRQVNEAIEKGKEAKHTLMFAFNYDEDPRAIFDIPEIRRYVKGAFEKYPYLHYLITPFMSNLAYVNACYADIEIKERKDNTTLIEILELKDKEKFDRVAMAAYCLMIALGEDDIKTELDNIAKLLNYKGKIEIGGLYEN